MVNGRNITTINNNCELLTYLINISDKTNIKKTYKKTLIVLNVKLFSIFEKVNKKQHINVKSGKYIGFMNLL
tara:strand:- start:120 stop:335 length:216 start_codon:yes stop_codon:yes gene_type:complete